MPLVDCQCIYCEKPFKSEFKAIKCLSCCAKYPRLTEQQRAIFQSHIDRKRKCQQCGVVFGGRHMYSDYCSHECRLIAKTNRRNARRRAKYAAEQRGGV